LVDAFSEMRKQIHHRQTALEYQALHDSLTGLANRTLLLDRLQQGIQQCARHQSALSLLI
ncbi:MAG: GGDEF domain-containing protein, partial [Gammaproteobacteria bacterium]|nr:GGDEF domain-containing protein [Gammaproteobacteria bacterium]